jgi:uncharacterized phage protein gp47/JayE
MPWTTPTLKSVRSTTRDFVTASLRGAVMVGNSVLRVMSDAMSGLAHLVLMYIDWVAKQLLPDSAEDEWLDRHGRIWLTNSDGTRGRKGATFAVGFIEATGKNTTPVPKGSLLTGSSNTIGYETTAEATLSAGPTTIPVRALTAGAAGNLDVDEPISFSTAVPGVDGTAVVVLIDGGVDAEPTDDLRTRVLERIQQPPMGGDSEDYVAWAKEVPGVTRAWSAPLEMGIGTVTLRFVMDDLRSGRNGIPLPDDVAAVAAWLDQKRPVAVKDFFCVAPIPQPVIFYISGLVNDDAATRGAIDVALTKMMMKRSKPGQTVFSSWAIEAISGAAGEDHHYLSLTNNVANSPGHMPIIGSIVYVAA